MKKAIKNLSILFLILFISCNSEDSSGEDLSLENNNDTIIVETSLEGQFVSDAHPTTGTVKVNNDQTKLSFENFMTDSGPNLLVYLSTTVNSTDYVDLGSLQGVSGNFLYTIPSNTDLLNYKYVVIWCVDFSVSFGHAELN